jgi:hypothetical protein
LKGLRVYRPSGRLYRMVAGMYARMGSAMPAFVRVLDTSWDFF